MNKTKAVRPLLAHMLVAAGLLLVFSSLTAQIVKGVIRLKTSVSLD